MVKFVGKDGSEVSAEKMKKLTNLMFLQQPSMKGCKTAVPPKDFGEFEDRLAEFYHQWQSMCFGVIHDIAEDVATIRKDRGPTALVRALHRCETYFNNHTEWQSIIQEPYQFLKMVLEQDAFLLGKDMWLLGIERDRAGITLSQKNEIALQAAAQVVWINEGAAIPTIKEMTKYLLHKRKPFYGLLQLSRFNGERALKQWVSKVCPVPKDKRRWLKQVEEAWYEELIPIPGIVTDLGISFPRLKFTVTCLTRVMKSLEFSLDEIKQSRPIEALRAYIFFYPALYLNDWVDEAYQSRDLTLFSQ